MNAVRSSRTRAGPPRLNYCSAARALSNYRTSRFGGSKLTEPAKDQIPAIFHRARAGGSDHRFCILVQDI